MKDTVRVCSRAETEVVKIFDGHSDREI